MFEQTFVNTHAEARRPWTVAASLTLQTGLVAFAIILPMLHPEVLHPVLEVPRIIYSPTKLVQTPVSAPRSPTSVRSPHRSIAMLIAPTSIPTHAVQVVDAPEPTVIGPGFIPGGTKAGIEGGIPGLETRAQALPELVKPVMVKPVARPEPPKGPVAVSTGVQAAKLIFGPKPAYPPLAKAARVQGVVRLQAIIAFDGSIQKLQVISGPPLLVLAAVNTVGQWRYQATLLNGQAVEVLTEIDVNFTLSQ